MQSSSMKSLKLLLSSPRIPVWAFAIVPPSVERGPSSHRSNMGGRHDRVSDPCHEEGQSCARATSFTTAGQPSCTLGYCGAQPDAWRNLRFEIRSDRASSSVIEPPSRLI